jgi:hypothetical protein
MTSVPTPVRWLHGTTAARAKIILEQGFKLPSKPSYVGRAICLTPSITLAYEYGAKEDRGVVLECRIRSDAKFAGPPADYRDNPSTDMAKHCHTSKADWMQAWGDMAIVSNPAVIEEIRILPFDEVLKRMVAEFEANGSDFGYNGRVADYAEIWHFEKVPSHPYDLKVQANLLRYTDFKARLEKRTAQPA